ncbi:ATP-binding protein, partial [bacterium]|nr:ATP-binding protein [bacterium]
IYYAENDPGTLFDYSENDIQDYSNRYYDENIASLVFWINFLEISFYSGIFLIAISVPLLGINIKRLVLYRGFPTIDEAAEYYNELQKLKKMKRLKNQKEKDKQKYQNNLKTLEKYYAADVGLRYMLIGRKNIDAGHILENIVYLEIVRRGYSVYVGKVGEQEVDFVAVKPKEGTRYFQVAASAREEKTLLRELAPLKAINDHYPKTLLTLDEDPDSDFDGIKKLNVLDWLLDK